MPYFSTRPWDSSIRMNWLAGTPFSSWTVPLGQRISRSTFVAEPRPKCTRESLAEKMLPAVVASAICSSAPVRAMMRAPSPNRLLLVPLSVTLSQLRALPPSLRRRRFRSGSYDDGLSVYGTTVPNCRDARARSASLSTYRTYPQT